MLTTLHTHNAASSIARLKDMGVEPGLLATSINCIVAQRLARRLCLECREAVRAERRRSGEELGLERRAATMPASTGRRAASLLPARATAAASRSTR